MRGDSAVESPDQCVALPAQPQPDFRQLARRIVAHDARLVQRRVEFAFQPGQGRDAARELTRERQVFAVTTQELTAASQSLACAQHGQQLRPREQPIRPQLLEQRADIGH